MTHAELVERAGKWLRGVGRCPVVSQEPRYFGGEFPDAIGFMCSGDSILIECKVSRSDFCRDRKKLSRAANGFADMGQVRYYLCPEGLIHPKEVSDGWGLMYAVARGIRIVKRPARHDIQGSGIHHEKALLVSLIRNAQKEFKKESA